MAQPMGYPIEQSVLTHVIQERIFQTGDRVGVAVSGGADSVALLNFLRVLRHELGITLSVVHFDHQLRGTESERDAQFVRDLALACGLDLVSEGRDVASEAKRNKWNLEDAARKVRYGFFQRLIDDGLATRIAVAHTADDQAETVLSHLIRGTGLAGLAGIHPFAGSPAGTIVRPLLPFRRSELRTYLREIHQNWCEDSTNSDVKRMRARIRGQLLPVLERDFSSTIVEHLCDLARLSREEELFWASLVEERFRSLARKVDGGVSIQVAPLLEPLLWLANESTFRRCGANALWATSRPLTERLIRRLYQEVRGNRKGLTAEHVEQVIRLAMRSSSGRRVELPDGVRVERVFDELVISRKAALRSDASIKATVSSRVTYEYQLALPRSGSSVVSVPEAGSRFCLKLIDWVGSPRETTRDNQIFDADSLRAPLILRNWRPGDAYTPCGRRQPRKLKEMFLALRIPAGHRCDWPVLESAGVVIWARGMPVAEEVRTNLRTRVGLKIVEEKL